MQTTTRPANDARYAKTNTITVVAWTKTGKRTAPSSRSARSWGIAVFRNGAEWVSMWRAAAMSLAVSHAVRVQRDAGVPAQWDHDVWGTSYKLAHS